MLKVTEMALACGRKRQRKETGLIHHFYHSKEDQDPVTIPLLENFTFALALLKSCTKENITEAKEILERLLSFQNFIEAENRGNFPIYIHDYPTCYDRYQGIAILCPLYWSLTQFHTVLGQELKLKVEQCIKAIVEDAEKKSLPYQYLVKLRAASLGLATFWEQKEKIEMYREELSRLATTIDDTLLCSLESLGDLLTSLQICYPSLKNSPFSFLGDYVEKTWHQKTNYFAGSLTKEFYLGVEPEPTLYDLYMGTFFDTFRESALVDSITHLKGALIHPFEDHFLHGINRDEYALAVQPFRLLWGTRDRIHTLVCQESTITSSTLEPHQVSMDFQLDEESKIAFYLDLSDRHKITVEGIPSTTFSLGESVTIASPPLNITLKLQLIEGDGIFLGHIMKGNRPTQLLTKGRFRFEAHDWQIFLRTVQQKTKCKVRALLTVYV